MTNPKHQYRRHKTGTVLAAVIACLGLGLVGCSNDSEPDPIPEANETTSPTTGATTEPTPTTPSWEDKYTEQELQAYETALDRWTAYETKAEPFWAAGKATPAAEAFFKEYWVDPTWRLIPYNRLVTYEQSEVKINGTPTVLWSKPVKIMATDTTGSVQIRQCIDYSSVSGTQHGKPIQQVESRRKPVQRLLFISQSEGYPWLISEVRDKPGKGGKDVPCKA